MEKASLRLYRELLKYGRQFPDYNMRSYTLRKVKEEFRKHRSETDRARISELQKNATEQLAIVKRQVVIYDMYKHDKSIIETKPGV